MVGRNESDWQVFSGWFTGFDLVSHCFLCDQFSSLIIFPTPIEEEFLCAKLYNTTLGSSLSDDKTFV